MKKFLYNRMTAILSILLLAVGLISIMGMTHVAMAAQKGELCVFFACGNANITGGSSSSSQPTPSTATLIVTKEVDCFTPECKNNVGSGNFHITVTGDNPSPNSFVGSADGTKVTLGAGNYNVDEDDKCANVSFVCIPAGGFTFTFVAKFSPDCTGSINAGETKECVITNIEQLG